MVTEKRGKENTGNSTVSVRWGTNKYYLQKKGVGRGDWGYNSKEPQEQKYNF